MSPWDLIGWALVSVFALCFAYLAGMALVGLWSGLSRGLRHTRAVMASKGTTPAQGQVWADIDGTEWLVLMVTREGKVVTRKGDFNQADDAIVPPGEWNQFVRENTLALRGWGTRPRNFDESVH